jgi:hypothetical protein
MEAQPSLIMIQFPVWEDARAEGLVRQCGGETGERRVELTERGRTALRRALDRY